MKILRFFLILTILLLLYTAVLICIMWPWASAFFGIVAVSGLVRKGAQYTSHGTARWADAADLSHMLDGAGLVLGYIAGKPSMWRVLMGLFSLRLSAKTSVRRFLAACQKKPPKHLVRLTNSVHTSIFAPTGVGKGVSCVIPFLLTDRDSAVVVDFKGELALATANHREREFGHRIVVLDPFNVVTNKLRRISDTCNPLDPLEDKSVIEDGCDLAASLVVSTGQEKEPHWNQSAEVWIAQMIMAVYHFAAQEDKSLQSVRMLLASPEKMQAAIKMMCESDAWDGLLARTAGQLGHYKDKELGSILTTTNRHLRFLDVPAIVENTKASSFDPSELLTGKMTIYLILPPEHMRAQAGLLRMWIGVCLRAVIRGGLQESKKVQFIIDEASSLGRMEAIEDAIKISRGYGARIQLYYQSVGQLKACFPDGQDQTLLSNVTQIFFGVNDNETAKYVSERLGEKTIIIDSGGSGDSSSTQTSQQSSSSTSSTSNNYNWSQSARKLLKPEEVMALDPRLAITFTPGVPPIMTRLQRYYEKDFNNIKVMSPWKAALDTACLFMTAALFAFLFTNIFLHFKR